MDFYRNIFRNFPVGRLPSDLRDGFEEDALVSITTEESIDLLPGMMIIEKFYDFRDGVVVTISERRHRAS